MLYPVTLDKERNFKFGMRALDLAEKKTGQAIMGLDLNSLTMEQMATLVWCGLVHEDKTLTVEKVMDIIDENSNFGEIMELLGNALDDAFGVNKEEKTKGKNSKKAASK
jgi:hypothetical protein